MTNSEVTVKFELTSESDTLTQKGVDGSEGTGECLSDTDSLHHQRQ